MLESTSCCDPRFFSGLPSSYAQAIFTNVIIYSETLQVPNCKNIFHLVVCLFVSFQDLGELQEAKQLLIQQKLELQGQVEATQGALEQEQKEHKATRESRNQREEQLFAQNQEVQDKLVNCLVPTE